MAKLPSFTLITSIGAVCGSLLIYKYIFFARFLREYINGPMYKGQENLEGKVILITGANSGIGKETVMKLAEKKSRIIMACRDMEKCKKVREDVVLETNNPNILCKPLNLASLDSVRAFVEYINSKEPIVNILINNAAIMNCPQAYTQNNFEAHYGVNYLGHFLLTSLLLPKLQASSPSRIINVIDPICRKGKLKMSNEALAGDGQSHENSKKYDAMQCYKDSKVALMAFSQELSNHLKSKDLTGQVDVVCVNPGIVNTPLHRYLPSHSSWISRYTWAPLMGFFVKDPIHGAQPIIYAACCHPLLQPKEGSSQSGPILISSGHTEFLKKPLDSLVKIDEKESRKLWEDSLRSTQAYRLS